MEETPSLVNSQHAQCKFVNERELSGVGGRRIVEQQLIKCRWSLCPDGRSYDLIGKVNQSELDERQTDRRIIHIHVPWRYRKLLLISMGHLNNLYQLPIDFFWWNSKIVYYYYTWIFLMHFSSRIDCMVEITHAFRLRSLVVCFEKGAAATEDWRDWG